MMSIPLTQKMNMIIILRKNSLMRKKVSSMPKKHGTMHVRIMIQMMRTTNRSHINHKIEEGK